jgi:L-asparaginase/Glu-tRNA(Gln) amidotransferase subunit D
LDGAQSLPYVDVLYIHTGTRPGLANALVAAGAKGIVIASVGAGSPGNLDKELGEIVKNRSAVVVQSSRVGEGRIVRNNNWYEPDMVVADNLSPPEGIRVPSGDSIKLIGSLAREPSGGRECCEKKNESRSAHRCA